MNRIRQLPPNVVNQIAAGEVIERPASVLKELLENSIDAGATRLDVDVEQGGVDLVRVVDNGHGIAPEDLPLALASHATSKLSAAEELFQIRTLGFRGEALASIGSVAKVRIQSRPAGAASGAELSCEGGDLGPVRPWNGAHGTRIEVRHLFYNTPARRKFLKATATEMGHVSETVTRLALAFPALHVKLCHNERQVFEVPASAPLRERLGLFFGGDLRDALLPIDAQNGPARLTGFVADPSCDRGNGRYQYLYVNGRWIRDRSLGHALQEAYHGLLMTGRYAVAFLFLDLPPDLVDVNVHPTKAEVRFRDSQAVYHLVLNGVRARLRNADLTANMRVPPQELPRPSAPSPQPRPAPAPLPDTQGQLQPAPASAPSPGLFDRPAPVAPPPEPAVAPNPPPSRPAPAEPFLAPGPPVRAFKAIQLHDSYLVVETFEGMLVIDQHALHERILFEDWKVRLRDGPVEAQKLLVPEPVDLPPDQANAALEHRETLGRLGLGVEHFGGCTVLVTSYPALLRKASPEGLVRAAVEFLAAHQKPPRLDQLLNDLLATMACKAAVKAGDRLSAEEISALVAQRHLADDTHHCPHGRPTALFFSKQELDRQFKRIG